MSENKIIAVVGATGYQGGGAAKAILSDPYGGYAVRALTRDVTSERAQLLAKKGAEVVQADNNDEESLVRAFQGAYGAFIITNFWEHLSADKELAEARNLANAARKAGLKHVVWSTLEDTRDSIPVDDDRMPTLQDRYKVPHFDVKADAERLFRDAGVPTTFLRTAFYWENLINGWRATRDANGVLTLDWPNGESRLAGIAAEDIGAVAYQIFKAGDEFVGKYVSVAGEFLTVHQLAEGLTRTVGEPVVYRPLSADEYRERGALGVEVGNMHQYYDEFAEQFIAGRDLDEVRRLHPALKSYEEWLRLNGHLIPTD
ncbi:NmrA/HSCARG family protein [Actinoplanes sp. TBRC 11911]|uniref:NmrA/HSCARG family protein n=1 Tax=Actinoplanes sp. TBRC 11911 TaxID=2729386 RepID=UPI00145E50BE|nr:NmrA/HSCARG family protein [Actinoplanes sp. TBRC 11911]NMO53741.1 NmrA/HSCARG family protein [Actinoplanes sp. TBRC 11911]